MRLYIHQNETTWGPYELEQVQELLQEGNITAGVLAAVEGSDQWTPLENLVRIEGAVPVLPTRLFTPPTWQTRPDNGELINAARKQLIATYSTIFAIAGINLIFGFASDLGDIELMRMFGSSSLMIEAGAIYLLLGILVVFKSGFALALALALYAAETLVLIYGSWTNAGYVPILSIALHLSFIVSMAAGFDALSKLHKLKAV